MRRLRNTRVLVAAALAAIVLTLSGEARAQRMVNLPAGDTHTLQAPRGLAIQKVVSTDPTRVTGAILPGNRKMTVVGVAPGSATLMVSYADGSSEQIQVSITYSGALLRSLGDALGSIEGITIQAFGERLLLEGTIYSNAEWERYRKIVDSSGIAVIDLVELGADQVNIQIDGKVTEINLQQLQQAGIDWLNLTDGLVQLADPAGARLFPNGEKIVGTVSRTTPLSAAIHALEEEGMAYAIARPSAVCTSGGEAEFTVGGEVPILTSNINGTTVQYRDFGVILKIYPTLVSFEAKTIRLVVEAELSEVDLSLSSGDFPGFSSRKVRSDIVVKDGQTIAIGGLLSQTHQKFESRLPVLGWIPVVGGLLFGSTRTETVEKETIIQVTPRLVTASSGENIRLDRGELEQDKARLLSRE